MYHSTFHFLIDHIDPLGQGVFKQDENIYFIPKTLPGETGIAKILKRKKNIHFCQLISLEKSSPDRVEASCPHFHECPACHFLHTSYEKEIELKAKSFKKILAPLKSEELKSEEFDIIKAPQRMHYRNRIQLHYRKKASEQLGYIDGKSNKIVEVPECKILNSQVSHHKDQVYLNKQALIQKQRQSTGHIEIYQQTVDKAVNVAWNRPYAQGGFSQVNEEMNQKLKDTLKTQLGDIKGQRILDLFGGSGNLTHDLKYHEVVEHIDLYDTVPLSTKSDKFHSLDLYNLDSLADFHKNWKKGPQRSLDIMLVDPPRAGFKHLNLWVQTFRPKRLCYISCHPATMVRDLLSLSTHYDISYLALIDLFPSTHHFESLTIIDFAQNSFYNS